MSQVNKTIRFHKSFKKQLSQIIKTRKNLKKRIDEQVILFLQDSTHPLLHDHGLLGAKRNLRSFSITGDIRIVYYIEDDAYIFVAIGPHNQVY